ncbi:MAG: glycosyltransferase family 9 protein [Bacteroidetes bacterium]|nr:MAG: glycosyltransferase family 9 protein [Bacteroidota bacterium]
MKKFLIIRFSSIGDIVLTTPVIRCLRKAYPQAEIHYLTKAAFVQVLQYNPHIDHLHLYKDKLSDNLRLLKRERFDYILDLHHNLRSLRVKLALRRPAASFDKQNWQKLLMVNFKSKRKLPHVVERYGQTLKAVGAQLDDEGLEFPVPLQYEQQAVQLLEQHLLAGTSPLAVVLGATYPTKRWLPAYFVELLNRRGQPVVLLGGKDAALDASMVESGLHIPCMNAVGKYPLLTSVALMKQCQAVLAHDTGLMHIAAALKLPVFSIWGNTVPEFGMSPYKTTHYPLENKQVSCRPCSKIGYKACPKGHFECMKGLKPEAVLAQMHTALPYHKPAAEM